MAARLSRYVRNLFRVASTLALVALVLAGVQAAFHPFDELIAKGETWVSDMESRLTSEAFNGITLGSLGLVLALCIFPIFLRRIDERAYLRSIWRGIVSAAVFYLSNELYALASKIGRVHFLFAMLAVIVATAVIVEGVSLSVKEEEERSFRTDVVASIASGLLFGVLVKLAQYGLGLLKGSS
jgi:hypothetical protein